MGYGVGKGSENMRQPKKEEERKGCQWKEAKAMARYSTRNTCVLAQDGRLHKERCILACFLSFSYNSFYSNITKASLVFLLTTPPPPPPNFRFSYENLEKEIFVGAVEMKGVGYIFYACSRKKEEW